MVLPFETYVFATQNLCFFQQTTVFLVLEKHIFIVINYFSTGCRKCSKTRVFRTQWIVCDQYRPYVRLKFGFFMT